MKKRLMAIGILCVIGIATLSACKSTSDKPKTDNTQPETAVNSPSSSEGNTDSSEIITAEDAERIALERAGLTADEVRFEKTELDRDDGILHYDVEFNKGREEYDVEVSAADGEILHFEKDIDD